MGGEHLKVVNHLGLKTLVLMVMVLKHGFQDMMLETLNLIVLDLVLVETVYVC